MLLKEYDLQGKVAIVSGGGRGIGKGIAILLAEAGAEVVVAARTGKEVEQTAREIKRTGRQALAVPTDIRRSEQIREMVERTVSEFGRIDILVNVAGIAPLKPIVSVDGLKPLTWQPATLDMPLTEEEWHDVLDTNLTAAFLVARAVGPYMIKQKKGKIINISSPSAESPPAYMSAYGASKAGLNNFTRCLASEWAPFNICVNAIGPGHTLTEMSKKAHSDSKLMKGMLETIPLRPIAEPREICLLAVYLASEASDFMTGQIIYLDGGELGAR